MHIVGSVKLERPSLQQMAKWRNRPGVVHRAFTLFRHVFHGFKEDCISFFVTFVLVSCSRVCLLDVSRLRGLTLRHFAPVSSCHRDSLTSWRLAIVQEAVRVLFFSQSSRLVSARDDMCPVVSDSLRGRSFHAMLNYEGPASLVKLFFTHSSFPCLLHSFRPKTRDTPGRARNVLHPVLSMYPPGLVENESYELP